MKKVLGLTAKTLGLGILVGLSVASLSRNANAFSFTSERINCGGSSGCVSSVTVPGVQTYAFEGSSPSFGTSTLGPANLATVTTPGIAAAPLGDTTQYAVVGKGPNLPNTLTVNFAQTDLSYLGLYWGSMDPSNEILFYSGLNGTGTLLGSLNGNQVTVPPGLAIGDQGNDIDNRYVNIFTDQVYRSVVFRTGQIAFEFDNVTAAVPEPTTIVGLAVAGMAGVWLKRRQKHQQTS